MLHQLAKKRMQKINLVIIDNDFKRAHSIHSIALEELRSTIKTGETQYSELINSISGKANNKGC